MPRPDPPEPFEAEAQELVARLRPRFVRICDGHGLSPEETREVIYEGVAFLLQRWRGLRDRETWLLRVVEEICADRVAATEAEEARSDDTEGNGPSRKPN